MLKFYINILRDLPNMDYISCKFLFSGKRGIFDISMQNMLLSRISNLTGCIGAPESR